MPFWKYPYTTPVEARRNLMTNPSFEVSDTGWAAFGGSPTVSRVTRPTGADPLAGAFSLRIQATTTSNNDVQSPQMPAAPGVTYTATGSMRSVTPKNNALIMRFYNSSDVLIGTSVLGTYVMSSASWATVTVTATAPALTAYVRIHWRVQSPAVGELHYLDTVLVEASSTVQPYFDGNYPAAGQTRYRWLGAADLSASVAETPGVADTLAPMVDALTPYGMSRETRTVAQELMESSSVRVAWYAPGARSGELRIGFAHTASAMAGMAWFSTNSTFNLDHSESYADMTFTVAGGDIRFERDEIVPVVLVVPFKELT